MCSNTAHLSQLQVLYFASLGLIVTVFSLTGATLLFL